MKINLKKFNKTLTFYDLSKILQKKYNDFYFTHNGKYITPDKFIGNYTHININFRLRGGSNIIKNEEELKMNTSVSNKIYLKIGNYNYNIKKIINNDDTLEISGGYNDSGFSDSVNPSNTVINGDIEIKTSGDVSLNNIKINGKINIIANNIKLNNIENTNITILNCNQLNLSGLFTFDDIFINGIVKLDGDVSITSNGIHLEDELITNNFKFVVNNITNNIVPNNSLNIKDPSQDLQKCLEITNILDAWKYCDLNKNKIVKVAVLDTGIDTNHPDLKDNILKNSSDNIIGKRFFNGNESDDEIDDDNGHGTHVAGIIAANSNNNIGISGISANNKIKIIPIKCINKYPDGYYSYNSDISNAIRWAVNNDADIINLSLGGIPGNDLIKSSIRYALKKGCLVIAAAGNSSIIDSRGFVEYPAAWSEVLSVGCIDNNDTLTDFSSYKTDETYPSKPEGHRGVDIVAPGLKVLSTYDPSDNGKLKDGYCYLSGTSMATPIVSGIAALLMQQYENYYRNPIAVRKVILCSSKDCGIPGYDKKFGYGLIDAKSAILYPYTASFYTLEESDNIRINSKYVIIKNKTIRNKIKQNKTKQNKKSSYSKKSNALLNSIKSNSLLFGGGLSLLLGFLYFTSDGTEEQNDTRKLNDEDINNMSEEELIKLEKYLMKKIG